MSKRQQGGPAATEKSQPPTPKPANTGAEFERYIQQLLRLSGYQIEHDVMVAGTQMDVVARSPDSLAPVSYLVECTDTAKNVSIEYVKEKAGALFDDGNGNEIYFLMIVAAHGFSARAKDFAKTRPRLILKTVDQLENQLIDFSPYRDWYTLNYRESVGVFEEARLFDHYVEISATEGNGDAKPLDRAVRSWLEGPDNNVLFLLGDYGAGKTSFLRHFTYKLLTEDQGSSTAGGPVPVLIPLREFQSAVNLRQVITDTLVNEYGVALPSFQAFERFCSLGKVLLLMDGFDEMANQSDVQTILDCLAQILLLAETNTKLIVTCRSNFFESHYRLFEMLRRFEIELPDEDGDPEVLPLGRHGRVLTLSPLSPKQVSAFIERRFPDRTAELLAQIKKIHDLTDLCKRPVLLDMVLSTLPEIHDEDRVVNSAVLYERYTNRWHKRDEWRAKMPREARQALCDSLAWAMLARNLSGIAFPDLRQRLDAVLASFARSPRELQEFANDIQTCSFLVREGEGQQFQFAHKSFMEYFVARRLAKACSEGLEIEEDEDEVEPESIRTILGHWRSRDSEYSDLSFVEARQTLLTRFHFPETGLWLNRLPPESRSLGATLEQRVLQVFDSDEVAQSNVLPFELTPEIATFALEWMQMEKLSLGDVIERSDSPQSRLILTGVLRHGTAAEYLGANSHALAEALTKSDPAFSAVAAAALMRTGHLDSAEALLDLRGKIPLTAFNYVAFNIAKEGDPNRVAILAELDELGELDDFGSIVATYAQRETLEEKEYSAAILSTVRAFLGASKHADIALEMLASTVAGDEALVEIVNSVVTSDLSRRRKLKAVALLDGLSPSSHKALRRVWTRVEDPEVRLRLQKIEERLRSIDANERDRRSWKRSRSANTDTKIWQALSLSAR